MKEEGKEPKGKGHSPGQFVESDTGAGSAVMQYEGSSKDTEVI